MQEKILTTKKNGMVVLLLTTALLVAATVGTIFGATLMDANEADPLGIALFFGSLVVLCIGWIPLLGLRVLKPQEALVVTLFGKYKGPLKGDGF